MISGTLDNPVSFEFAKGSFWAMRALFSPIFANIWVISVEFTFRQFFGEQNAFSLDSDSLWIKPVHFV
jgi:hypothetical protein